MKKILITKPLRFVDGVVTIDGVKLYNQQAAMDVLGITRPTYYKYVAQKKILRIWLDPQIEGQRGQWVVSDGEIKRVKEIIDAGWVRGKAKLPKKKAAKR